MSEIRNDIETGGAGLRRVRERSGKTMGDLARFLGVSVAVVSRLELDRPIRFSDGQIRAAETPLGPEPVCVLACEADPADPGEPNQSNPPVQAPCTGRVEYERAPDWLEAIQDQARAEGAHEARRAILATLDAVLRVALANHDSNGVRALSVLESRIWARDA